MESNNIIKILSNIYLYNNYNIDVQYIKNNSIKSVIIINNTNIEDIDDNSDFEKKNISINETNIDFEKINNLIIGVLKKSRNILIVSDKNLYGFIIIGVFMINNLDVSLFQILLLGKYYNINLTENNEYKLLQTYYNNKKKILS